MNGKLETDQDQQVTQLIEELNFHPLNAKIFVKDNGNALIAEWIYWKPA
jgi:hypothetical protein